MAKFYLENNDVNQHISNKNTSVYGANATESVIIDSGVTGTIVDQNVEAATFATGSTTDYKYAQSGNKLKVYAADGTTLVADVALNSAGTPLTFSNGTVTAAYSTTGVINLGGKAVTSTATVIDATATVDATKTSGGTGGTTTTVTGSTFTLTTGADNLVGTSGNDTFYASYTSANGMTFQSGDVINGAGGVDTLSISVGSAGTFQAASISNIEKIDASFSAGTAVSLLGVSGLTNLGLIGSTSAAKFTNVGNAGVGMKVSNSASNADFQFTTQSVSGTSDVANVELASVTTGTTLSINGVTGNFETVALTSSASENILDALVTTNATSVTVAGDQKLTITGSLDATVANFDASSNTGGVVATLGAVANATVTGSPANDTLTVSAVTGNVKVTAGAGDDTVVVALGLSTTDTLSGGDGIDTLSTTNLLTKTVAYTTPSTRTITGFETLKLTDAADAAFKTSDIDTGINKVIFATAGANTSANVEFSDGASTLEIGTSSTTAAALATAITVDAKNTTPLGGDSLSIVNKNSGTVDAFGSANISSTDFETITINSGSYTSAVTQNIGTISVTGSTDFTSAETVKFAGANNIVAGIITADIIDASALTSTTTGTVLTTVTGTTATTVIGSAGKDILVADTTNNVSISGGAGNDSITGGAGNDILNGDAGDDSITSAAGNDTLNGGDGNDTFVLAANLATGDSLDGGAGNDTISVTNASLTTVNAYSISAATNLNAAINNIERATISDALNQTTFDLARLDGINYVTLAAGFVGTNAGTTATTGETLSGLVSGSTIILKAGDTAATDNGLALSLSDSSGTSDSLTVGLVNDVSTDFAGVILSGVENLTLTTAEVTATTTAEVHTIDVSASGLTSLTLSGTESLDLTGIVIGATTIDASAIADSSALTAPYIKVTGNSANQSITGSAGADTIDGGAGADTINGGNGADSLLGGAGIDSIVGGNGADSIIGGAGNDIIVLTESSSAVDVVTLNYSEAGSNIDSIVGFAKGASGDNLKIDMTALELTGTGNSGIRAGGVVDFIKGDSSSVGAGASVLQEVTTAATMTATADVFAIVGARVASLSDLEDALEVGGSFALTTGGAVAANDAFLVLYSDGTNAHLAAVYSLAGASSTTFSAGDLVAKELVSLTGVSSIAASDFNLANFTFA